MNIAVILAGGSGTRMGNDIPKQFVCVAGRTIIEHTVRVFENNRNIDEICIVCKSEYEPRLREIVARNRFVKVKKIIQGGQERYHSSLAAVNAYVDDNDNLIFHDAVRPLVNDRMINDCLAALEKYEAVNTVVPATDTIVRVDENGFLCEVPSRSMLRKGQSPQGFRRGTIAGAYRKALEDAGFTATDDCGVVKKYLPDVPIAVVEGESYNIKLTYPEDVVMFEYLLGQGKTK